MKICVVKVCSCNLYYMFRAQFTFKLAFPISPESFVFNKCFATNKKPQHGVAHQGEAECWNVQDVAEVRGAK